MKIHLRINKHNDLNILDLEIETFDYYSNNPKSFDELLDMDKRILNLIKTLVKGKIYVLASMEIVKPFDSNYGLWDYHSLPNEDPNEDFKYQIIFPKSLCEYKFINNNSSTYNGIAEITIDFYLRNYLFFNRGNGTSLIICDEEKIDSIIRDLSKVENVFHINVLEHIAKQNSVVLTTFDDEEYKEIKIIFSGEIDFMDEIRNILK